MERTRVSLSVATKTVLAALADGSTVTELATKSQLNRKTVNKVLKILQTVQDFTENNRIEISKIHSTRSEIRLLPREPVFTDLPLDTQAQVIRGQYFPTPSREEEILTFLLNSGAVDPTKAKKITDSDRSQIVEKLIQQGQIEQESKGGYYLSDEGKTVATGATMIYPELRTPAADLPRIKNLETFARMIQNPNLQADYGSAKIAPMSYIASIGDSNLEPITGFKDTNQANPATATAEKDRSLAGQ